jgi:multidrug efflux pump
MRVKYITEIAFALIIARWKQTGVAAVGVTFSITLFIALLGFMEGLTGALFKEFAFTLACAVIISGIVALTLSPMMCSKILKRRVVQPWLYRKTEPFFTGLTNAYAAALEGFMKRRWLGFTVILLSGFLIYYLGKITPSELAPLEDRSEFRLQAQAQEGATFEYMDRNVKELTQFISEEVPEKSGMVSVTASGFGTAGVNSGFIRVILKDPKNRDRTQQQIVDDVTGQVKKYSGVRTFITQGQTIGDRRGGFPLQFVIQAADIDKLKKYVKEILF